MSCQHSMGNPRRREGELNEVTLLNRVKRKGAFMFLRDL